MFFFGNLPFDLLFEALDVSLVDVFQPIREKLLEEVIIGEVIQAQPPLGAGL